MKPGRFAIAGALGFFWMFGVFALGVFIAQSGGGENFGKFVGTIVSGVAFIPPVIIFMKWYQAREGSAIANRPAVEDLIHHNPSGGDTP